MFIIIPFIIIFVLFAYLQINDNLSTLDIVITYGLMIITVIISLVTYIKIKNDFKEQEKNSLILEIYKLRKKHDHSENKDLKEKYQQKIDILEEELKNLEL